MDATNFYKIAFPRRLRFASPPVPLSLINKPIKHRPLTLSAAPHSVSAVLLRLAKFIMVLALAGSIGLHWVALQSLAWTSMLADNLRHDSLAQAVTHTFDGQHPCCLCKAIAAGKKSEKKSEFTPFFKTLEFPPASEDFALTIEARFALPPAGDIFARTLSETPPTPPPRDCFA